MIYKYNIKKKIQFLFVGYFSHICNINITYDNRKVSDE